MSERNLVRLNVGEIPAPDASTRDALTLLTELSRRVGSSLDLHQTLDAVANALVEALGFAVAVVNLVIDDGSLEAVVVAGNEESRQALLGSQQSKHSWDLLLESSEPWGRLRFLDHTTAQYDPVEMLMWVPDIPISDEPDAWHPEDALFAPLHASDGTLLGVLSVDVPLDGKRPGEQARLTLEAFALQAELAIDHAAVHSRLRHSEGLFRAVVEASPIAIAQLDRQRCIVAVNDAFTRLLGRSREELVGHSPLEFTHPDDVTAHDDGGESADQSTTAEPVDKRYLRPDGQAVWGRLHITHLGDYDDVAMVAHVEDITQSRQVESRLRHDALHDSLTGLPNRTQVMDRLGELCGGHGARRRNERVCVLYCDVDHFKLANDTHGHAVGDVLLEVIAHRLRDTLRAGDTVGRLGGDEFVVLSGGVVSEAEAVGLAGRLAAAVANPVRIGELVLTPTVSVGVALSASADTAEVLLQKADQALYQAKATNRGSWVLFSPTDEAERHAGSAAN